MFNPIKKFQQFKLRKAIESYKTLEGFLNLRAKQLRAEILQTRQEYKGTHSKVLLSHVDNLEVELDKIDDSLLGFKINKSALETKLQQSA